MRRGPLAVILLAGFLLRVLYLHQVAALPFFDQPFGDSEMYMRRVREILEGSLVPARPFFYGSVLYPYLIAAVLSAPGGSLYLVCLLQAVAGILLAYLLARTARRLFGRRSGCAAAAITALYGPFAFMEADLIGVAWGLPALGAGILWCVRWAGMVEWGGGAGPGYLLLGGAAFGLAASERPNLLLLAPLAAAWAAWTVRRAAAGGGPARGGGRLRAAPAAAAALVAGTALAAAPPVLLNAAGTGSPRLVNTSFGINLYIGNNARADGTFDEPWARERPHFTARFTHLETSSLRAAAAIAGRPVGPEEASRIFTRKALGWIAEDPAGFLRLTARKLALAVNAAEISNHLNFVFMRRICPALWLMPLGFGVVAPLAALGAVRSLGAGAARRLRPGPALLLLVAAGVVASLLPFFIAERYRAPLVVPLVPPAASAAATLWRAARDGASRRDGRLALPLGACLAALAAVHLPLTRPDVARGHWLLAQALKAKGDLEAARREYEVALALSGEDGVLLNNLGLVHRALGDGARAEAALRRAIRADPALAYPHKNLAWTLLDRGERDEAVGELREAARLDPEDVETLGALAELLAEGGRAEEASAVYAEARRLDPEDPRLARLAVRFPTLVGEASAPRATP
jgi:tetratricopeptide (TPR) repeat protein